jgi:ribosomal protein L11 methyltransferase
MNEKEESQPWEQVSIEVELGHAERLATLLGEILPGGVVLEKNYGDLFPHELDQFKGPVRMYGYFPSAMRQEIQLRISNILKITGQRPLLKQVEYAPLENQNWATAWQEHYCPVPVGKSLVIVPTWLENPYPGRIPIWMDPGMAFGSGIHPTTQICLAFLERSLTESLPEDMIDVGCGSGILAIGAVKLGVREVLGVDNDPDAIRVSNDNARVNGVSGSVGFREGSVKDILGQERQFKAASLVVANIIAPILIDLFEDGLGELVCPGGRIILSGILKDQLPDILLCLGQHGFILAEEQEQGDWVGLIAEKTQFIDQPGSLSRV